MKNFSSGFSFVELIVVISIISLISVIGLSINNNYTEKSKNTRITADVQTLKNALESYRNDNKNLPEPKGNQKYFDDSANYVHYDEPTAYGVAGFINEDTIPNKYLNSLPLDPRTNQYYAYGKTLTGGMYFEISGVNKVNGNYEAMVVGDYTGETGPYNLIREYNGPDFVYDKSRTSFPYNPDERILRAKIGTYSGAVTVNGNPINSDWTKNNYLQAGDTINVPMGGQAVLYFNDGSKSYLGDTTRASELTLANMKFKEENNLYTKIQLALSYGSIWTMTSKLDSNSDFEIYTVDTEAAVRGTIFGVSRNDFNTYVQVQTGSVEIKKLSITSSSSINDVINDLKNEVNIDSIDILHLNNMVNSVSLTSGTHKIGSTIQPSTSITTVNIVETDGLTNIQPKLLSTGSGTARIGFPLSFDGTNMKVKLNPSEDIISIFNSNILTLTLLTYGTQYELEVCDQNSIRCSKKLFFKLTEGVSLGDKELMKELGLCDDFGKFGCVPKDESLAASGYTLVAYAPYDRPGDIDMYTKDGVLYKETKGIILARDETDTDDFASFTGSSGFNCNPLNGFCEKDGVRGIFMGTGSNIPDYLKYDIRSLGLGSSFAVEMGVRGEALKRTSGTYNFFQSDDYYNCKMYNSSGIQYIQLQEKSTSIIKEKNNSLSDLNNNSFYKIIIYKDGTYGNFFINGSNFNHTTNSLNSSYNLGNNIYIGSSTSNTNQLNNIIDYIKIYKK